MRDKRLHPMDSITPKNETQLPHWIARYSRGFHDHSTNRGDATSPLALGFVSKATRTKMGKSTSKLEFVTATHTILITNTHVPQSWNRSISIGIYVLRFVQLYVLRTLSLRTTTTKTRNYLPNTSLVRSFKRNEIFHSKSPSTF